MAGGLAGAGLLARLWSAQVPAAPAAKASEAPPAEPASEAPSAEKPAPNPDHPARERAVPASQQTPPVEDVREGSLALMRALIARDLETLSRLTPTPFSFDGTEATTRAAVRQRWAALLERYPIDQLELRGVEVLSYDDLVAKHGKPPVRLQRLPLPGSQAAIVDLNGKAAVLLWRKRAKGFQLFAISD